MRALTTYFYANGEDRKGNIVGAIERGKLLGHS